MRCGLPAGVRLLLLPSLLDDSGTDHQGVVLDPSTLQPWSSGQPASLSGSSLVPLLDLPTHPITSTWRWDELPGHGIARTFPVTAGSLNVNRPCVFTSVVMVNIIRSSRVDHLSSRRGRLGWEEAGIVSGRLRCYGV